VAAGNPFIVRSRGIVVVGPYSIDDCKGSRQCSERIVREVFERWPGDTIYLESWNRHRLKAGQYDMFSTPYD